MIIDESTEFGARVAAHLREEIVVWMTVVAPKSGPLPMPVWFLWEGGETVRMFSRDGARVRNVEANPRVTLNFGGDGGGGDIVVVTGTAAVDPETPPADRSPDYLAKYDEHIESIGMTPASFAEAYSLPLRVRFTRVDGH